MTNETTDRKAFRPSSPVIADYSVSGKRQRMLIGARFGNLSAKGQHNFFERTGSAPRCPYRGSKNDKGVIPN